VNIFFDLDGTLVDGQDRLYQLFVDLTKNNKISFNEYWRLKRSMFDHEWILTKIFDYSEKEWSIFCKRWLELIETDAYLKYNRLFDYTIPTLENLKKHNLYIITARQYKEKTLEEIERMNIRKYFCDILITKEKLRKDELIIEKGIHTYPEDFFIGDTGIDILAGKKLNMRTIAVLSGFRGYESLVKYQPDRILTNISELNKIII
jgi:phosphoglycolate phosphatase